MAKERTPSQQSWLDRPLLGNRRFSWEHAVVVLLLLAAVVTRFHMLGERVMSHDETTHVYFSWQLFKGQGYQHHPLSHGPVQFHMLALSYFLFGDNDFTARAPQALFGVAVVFFVWWAFRRYLGRTAALLASFFFLISPYVMYYSRYARNEIFVTLFGLVMLWAILRYLDTGLHKYIYIAVAAISLHFTSKETSFIYLAQALIFLGLVFLWRISPRKWKGKNTRLIFFVTLILSVSLFLLAIGAQIQASESGATALSATQVEEPVVATETGPTEFSSPLSATTIILGGLGAASLITALVALFMGYGLPRLRQERAFVLMGLLFALVLPHLAAFPIRWLHHDPMAYQDTSNLIFISGIVAVLVLLSGGLGFLINGRAWLISTAVFYAIFVPFYTTIFSNGVGFFSGLVGSLGYWLEQQAVERGNQPSYYYWGVQIPMYEFLAAAGSLLAAVMGLRSLNRLRGAEPDPDTEDRDLLPHESRRTALALFAFWAVSALAAYTIAGERMPWLTLHIAIPMLLLAAWAVSRLIARLQWANFAKNNGWMLLGSLTLALVAGFNVLSSLWGTQPPFQGNELPQLQATYHFLFFLITLALGVYGVMHYSLQGNWSSKHISKLALLLVFAALALVTLRISLRANFRTYDQATEYLVYAHMAPGAKIAMSQIEEISRRTTDTLDLQVAYDNETSYPFWWYLRNYPNQRYYADQPSRDLRQFPVIIVGDTNYGKIEPIVGQSFYMFEYMRIWWPNQDYFDFTRSSIGYRFTSETGLPVTDMSTGEYLRRVAIRLWEYFGDATMRQNLWDIWLHGDFTGYLEGKGQNPSLEAWSPGRTMRVYIRKDVAAQIWDYGVQGLAPEDVLADPYEGKGRALAPQFTIGGFGSEPGQFIAPRNAAVAPDGTLYVADTGNHRIQHLSPEGSVLSIWGSFGDVASGSAEGGIFNEPWSVAVSPDGRSVYVADTWNHRIQQFTASGQFVRMWGYFGQDESSGALWGPRDVAVLSDGNVIVTDTGNKRIRMYDAQGNHLADYGEFGFEAGQFDEPVGLAYDAALERIYVADTWNQRVQVLEYRDGRFIPITNWEIAGWYGQSLVNKPYLSVGKDSQVFIADPEAGRVLVYNPDGTLAYFFGGYDQEAANILVAQGAAADPNGGVWVIDSQNAVVMWFEESQ
ncbi:MAG: TIGR03663 family protein [Anaerolineales bacterium]|nr:MAG: TIGR03663 family protein [Anaerolineales bacterium]